MLDAFSKQETQIKGGCKLENSRRLSRCNTTATASVHRGHRQLDALSDRSVSRCGCHAVSSWEDRCVCFLGLGRGGVDCGPRRQLRDYPNRKPNRTELRIRLFFFPQREVVVLRSQLPSDGSVSTLVFAFFSQVRSRGQKLVSHANAAHANKEMI